MATETDDQFSDGNEYQRATQELARVLERSREHETFCYARRDELIDIARGQQERREDNESQDRIGAATVAKLYDTALKWHRAGAEELGRQIETLHDRMLTEHERDMAAAGRRDGK